MRTLYPLILALLSGAYGVNAANCNTHQARTGAGLAGRQIADELLGVLDTVANDLCKGASSGHDAEPRTYRYNSMVFAISQKDSNRPVTNCSTPFVDIISQCISQAGYWGGHSSFQGLTYEIYNEAYPASGVSKEALEIRAKPKGGKKTPPSVPAKPKGRKKTPPSVPAKPTNLKGKPPVPTKHATLKGKPPVPTKPSSLRGKTLTRTTTVSTSSVLGCKPRKKAPTHGKPKKQTNGKPKVHARSEPSISRHARDFSVSPHSTRQLFRRVGTPPPCRNDNAGEDQGCFTVQDEAGKPVRFALPQGKTEFGGGLGSGGFGGVEKCIRKDGLDIAVKIYRNPNSLDAKHSFELLKLLEVHQNIIRAYGYGTVKGKPALAMELLTGGDAKSRIARGDWKGKANEREFKAVGRQILNGVSHMHSRKIAHCDIQTGNVAFEGNTPKFIDFDFACQDMDCLHRVPAGADGPPEAVRHAKEINDLIQKNKPIPTKFIDPYANDVWNTATMLVHMTTGTRFPATGSRAFKLTWSQPDQNKRIVNLFKVWEKENFSYEFVELLADIFTTDDKRIKINEFRDRFRDLSDIYC